MSGLMQHTRPPPNPGELPEEIEAQVTAYRKELREELHRLRQHQPLENIKPIPPRGKKETKQVSDIQRKGKADRAAKPTGEKEGDGDSKTNTQRKASRLEFDFPDTIFTPCAFAVFRVAFEQACHHSTAPQSQQRKVLLRHIKKQTDAAVKRIPDAWDTKEILDFIGSRVRGDVGRPPLTFEEKLANQGTWMTREQPERTLHRDSPDETTSNATDSGLDDSDQRSHSSTAKPSEYQYLYRMLNPACQRYLDETQTANAIANIAKFAEQHGKGTQWDVTQPPDASPSQSICRRVVDEAIDIMLRSTPSTPQPRETDPPHSKVGADRSCRSSGDSSNNGVSDIGTIFDRDLITQLMSKLEECQRHFTPNPEVNANDQRSRTAADTQRQKEDRVKILKLRRRLQECELRLRARYQQHPNARPFVGHHSLRQPHANAACRPLMAPSQGKQGNMQQPPPPRWAACK